MATLTVTKGYNSPTGWVSGEVVTPEKLNLTGTPSVTLSGIVNADVDSAAAIAHSKLANITSASILMGNSSNVPTATAVSGDVTISSAGVTAIGSGKVLPAMLSQKMTLETSKATTSGSTVEFTSIPSWVTKITMMLNGVSTSTDVIPQIQLGSSSGYKTGSGDYIGTSIGAAGGVGASGHSTGFVLQDSGATSGASNRARYGICTFCHFGSNTWIANGVLGNTGVTECTMFGGAVSLSGTLDRIRLNSGGTFDAGSINIIYEG